jgi:hypothetical protein
MFQFLTSLLFTGVEWEADVKFAYLYSYWHFFKKIKRILKFANRLHSTSTKGKVLPVTSHEGTEGM